MSVASLTMRITKAGPKLLDRFKLPLESDKLEYQAANGQSNSGIDVFSMIQPAMVTVVLAVQW